MADAATKDNEPLIRNISDTARWAAFYRAMETERDDACFRDPFARRLAGDRGAAIAQKMHFHTKHAWSWIARTYIFDHFILEEICRGVDMVVNLACGLDTRPLRMNLPPELQWVEVDLPAILDYKDKLLGDVKPSCNLERIRLDLSDRKARQDLFTRLASRSKRSLIITEGLIIYFTIQQVKEFAEDLATPASFQRWVLDLVSPALLKMMRKQTNAQLQQSGSELQFAPQEGPEFFSNFGWKVVDVRTNIVVARKLKRLPWSMKLWGWMPDTKGRNPKAPWGGGVLLGK